MNPTHLRLRNVGRFADLDIDLPAGTVALVGSNGAGKSTLLNAIDIALFAERGELTDLITTGEDRLEIELTFEHDHQVYRVRRQCKRGKSPTVDFERCDWATEDDGISVVSEWRPLTRENAAATNALIAQTLGLTRKTFRASSFLKQGDTAAFTEADPAARKALLAEILRLNLWDDSDGRKPATDSSLLGLARADLRAAEQKLPSIEARIQQIDEQLLTRDDTARTLDAYRAQLQTATDGLVVAEARLEKAQTAKAANEAAAERLRACQAELAAAQADLRRAETEFAEAAAAEQRRTVLQAELAQAAQLADQLPALEQQAEQHRQLTIKTAERDTLHTEARQRGEHRGRLVDEALRLNDQARELRAKADLLLAHQGDAGECDRCGQTLGHEAAERAAASYQADATDADQRARTLDAQAETMLAEISALLVDAAAVAIPVVLGDPGTTQGLLQEARAAGERRATLTEQVRQVAELAARKPALELRVSETQAAVTAKQAVVDEVGKTVGVEAILETAVLTARATVDTARERQQQANTAIARTEQLLEQLDTAATERDTLTAERETVQAQVEQFRAAVNAYGRNGIPALIVETVAVPQIEQDANRRLAEMPTLKGRTLQVQLRTQRELKDTAELRDALDIVVFDGDGERSYESYSGGEQGRLNFCLRVALARLLRNRRGAESRLLAVDEIPYLDDLGQEQIVEQALGLAQEFDRIVVIGHSERFQQSFDQVIVVEEIDGRSVVGNDTAAAVAA